MKPIIPLKEIETEEFLELNATIADAEEELPFMKNSEENLSKNA